MSDQNQQTAPTDLKTFLVPATILLTGAMIAGALFFGLRGTSESGNTADGTVKGEQATNPTPTPTPTQDTIPPIPQVATTSIDDDAIMGNRNTATVAIIEFSDYECGFCKRFVDQTLPQIKQNYIDTGQAILVFRDLPLSPQSENDAIATECAKEQGGDAGFYQMHDKIFKNIPGGGEELDNDELAALAVEIGLNGEVLKTCVSDKTFKSEVAADAADAASAGIKGTPGFVVGKLADDGSVEGTVIIGAQPYAAFQSAIEKYLE